MSIVVLSVFLNSWNMVYNNIYVLNRFSWMFKLPFLSLLIATVAIQFDCVLLNISPLSANPTKWPKTLKQFVGKLPTTCLSVFGHFVNLAHKGLSSCLHVFFKSAGLQACNFIKKRFRYRFFLAKFEHLF